LRLTQELIMPWVEFCMRLVLALVFGCVIGFERQLRQRLAGMRTNTPSVEPKMSKKCGPC